MENDLRKALAEFKAQNKDVNDLDKIMLLLLKLIDMLERGRPTKA